MNVFDLMIGYISEMCLCWPCRQSAKSGPNILVIRDGGRHVFGSFCSEGWKISSRYFGTGESFVFQIQVWLCLYDLENL